MTLTTLALVAGWLAIPFSILRFQMPTRTGLLAMGSLTFTLLGVHLIATGLVVGGMISLLSAFSAGFQAYWGQMLSMKNRLLFAIAIIGLSLSITQEGAISWIPIAAFCFCRFLETLEDDFYIRSGILLSGLSWILYFYLGGSTQALIIEMLAVGSNMLGIWRYHKHRLIRQAS